VARKAGGRAKQLIDGVEQEGWRFVAFVRLVPLFPFNLLNYALGLTRIPFPAYVIASWLFMLPGAFAYTWLGFAGREAKGHCRDRRARGQGLRRRNRPRARCHSTCRWANCRRVSMNLPPGARMASC
jgi:hypothetical protein